MKYINNTCNNVNNVNTNELNLNDYNLLINFYNIIKYTHKNNSLMKLFNFCLKK